MLPEITYKQIIDKVKNYIINNCSNVNNYNSLPNYLKSGYDYTRKMKSAGIIISIRVRNQNPVTSVSSSTVENDLNNFLSSCGLDNSQFNYPVDPQNLLNLIYDLQLFCSTKTVFAMIYSMETYLPPIITRAGNNGEKTITSTGSVIPDTKYTVYYNNTIDNTKIKKLAPKQEGQGVDLVYDSKQMQDLILNFIDSLKKATIRIHPIKYVIAFQ